MFEEWEKDDLISNLVADLSNCDQRIQDKMIALAEEADEEYGRRLREGLAQAQEKIQVRNHLAIGRVKKPLNEQSRKGMTLMLIKKQLTQWK